MSLYTWIAIIIIALTIGIVIYLNIHYDTEPAELFVIFLLGALLQATLVSSIESKQPKPIDVYRGKTTLKISFVDSIPQDTVVIWK